MDIEDMHMDIENMPQGARVRIEFEAIVHSHNKYGWTRVHLTGDPDGNWRGNALLIRTAAIREVLPDPLTERVGAVIDLEREGEPAWRFMLTTSGWVESDGLTYSREEMVGLIKSSDRSVNLIVDGGNLG